MQFEIMVPIFKCLICVTYILLWGSVSPCLPRDVQGLNGDDYDTKNSVTVSMRPNSLPQPVPLYLRQVVPIILESVIDSRLVKVGDSISAKLKENLYYGRQLIVPANSILNGHIISIRNSRSLSQSLFDRDNRFKSNAALEIMFENICLNENYVVPITGKPVGQESSRIGTDGLLYSVRVDHNGKIIQGGRTISANQRRACNTLRVATAVPLPTGVLLNIAAAPIVMTTVGAFSPEIVFNHPVDAEVSQRRLKGMAYGFATSLPGAIFVQSVIEKGNEIILSKGDEMMIDVVINNQLIDPMPTQCNAPEALIVKAELLKEALPEPKSDLPLKSYIEDQPLNSDLIKTSDRSL